MLEKLKMTDLTISIVSYKTRDLVEKCLKSIYQNTKEISFEIFVIDNDSGDGTMEMIKEKFPQVNLIVNKQNRGFAFAHNQALKKAKGKFLILLNPDCRVYKNTFLKMIKFLKDNPEVGIISPKIAEPGWRIGPVARGEPSVFFGFLRFSGLYRFFPKLTAEYYKDLVKNNKIQEVSNVGGTAMMIKREVIKKIGLLDESFFLYFEDFDFCLRAREKGFKVFYYPKATILHFFGESSKQNPTRVTNWYFNSMKRLYNKHFAPKHGFLFNQMTYFGLEVFKIKEIIKRIFSKNKKVTS